MCVCSFAAYYKFNLRRLHVCLVENTQFHSLESSLLFSLSYALVGFRRRIYATDQKIEGRKTDTHKNRKTQIGNDRDAFGE